MENAREQFEVSAEVKDLLEVMSQVKSAFDKFNGWESKYRQNKVARGNDVLGAFSDLQDSLNYQLTDLL